MEAPRNLGMTPAPVNSSHYVVLIGGAVALFIIGGIVGYIIGKGGSSSVSINYSEGQAAGSILSINKSLLDASTAYQQASSTQKQSALASAIDIAKQRKQVMLGLAKNNPAQFIQNALTPQQRNSMPSEIQALTEIATSVSGKFSIIHGDDFVNKKSVEYPMIATNVGQVTKRYALNFTNVANIPKDILPGTEVSASGVILDSQLVLTSGISAQVATITPSPTPVVGGQKTLVVLVNFQDAPSTPYTKNEINDLVFGNGQSVNSFYKENSFQKVSFSGDVMGWYTINIGAPKTTDECGSSIFDYIAATDTLVQNQGISFANYAKRLYVFPPVPCPFGGMVDGLGNPVAVSIGKDLNTFKHELGHTLGMNHAAAFNCGSIVNVSECPLNEYGDGFDVMGSGALYHFNVPHKIEEGWIPNVNIKTVLTDGTYKIYPLENTTGNLQAIRIPKMDALGAVNNNIYRESYYISYRQPIGMDASLPKEAVGGAMIHLWGTIPKLLTKLIDTSPLGEDSNVALQDGKEFYDPVNEIRIRQISHNSQYVTVAVSFSAREMNRAEAARFIIKAKGTKLNTANGPHFQDVPATHSDYGYIETLYNDGATAGCATGKYCPDSKVTRAQLVTFLVKEKAYPLQNPSTPHFRDVPTASPYYKFIETAYLNGLIAGYSDGTFKPDQNITLAQAYAVIFNAYK